MQITVFPKNRNGLLGSVRNSVTRMRYSGWVVFWRLFALTRLDSLAKHVSWSPKFSENVRSTSWDAVATRNANMLPHTIRRNLKPDLSIVCIFIFIRFENRSLSMNYPLEALMGKLATIWKICLVSVFYSKAGPSFLHIANLFHANNALCQIEFRRNVASEWWLQENNIPDVLVRKRKRPRSYWLPTFLYFCRLSKTIKNGINRRSVFSSLLKGVLSSKRGSSWHFNGYKFQNHGKEP